MTWHHDQRIKDGVLRHPGDFDTWKSFDEFNLGFARDPHNVKLGLATNRVDLFGNLSISYSTWSMIVIIFNLPPWLCIKQPYCMLSLLMRIELLEMKVMSTDNIQQQSYKSYGTMELILMMLLERSSFVWLMPFYEPYDFPTYANLSYWSTKGALACLTCNKETLFYSIEIWL